MQRFKLLDVPNYKLAPGMWLIGMQTGWDYFVMPEQIVGDDYRSGVWNLWNSNDRKVSTRYASVELTLSNKPEHLDTNIALLELQIKQKLLAIAVKIDSTHAQLHWAGEVDRYTAYIFTSHFAIHLQLRATNKSQLEAATEILYDLYKQYP